MCETWVPEAVTISHVSIDIMIFEMVSVVSRNCFLNSAMISSVLVLPAKRFPCCGGHIISHSGNKSVHYVRAVFCIKNYVSCASAVNFGAVRFGNETLH